jgi:hypothetical protein
MLELAESCGLPMKFCQISHTKIDTIEHLQAGNAEQDKQGHNGKKSIQQFGMNSCRDPGEKIRHPVFQITPPPM